jgi:hypothetical protein
MQPRIRHDDAVARQDASKNGEKGPGVCRGNSVDDRLKDQRPRWWDAKALLPIIDFIAGPTAGRCPGKASNGRKQSAQNVFDRPEDRQACRVIGPKDFFARVHVDQAVRWKLELISAGPGMRELASKGNNAVRLPDHFIEDVYVPPIEIETQGQRVIFRKNSAAGYGGEDGRIDQLRKLLY